MNKFAQKKLLREYIRHTLLLSEDYYADASYGGYYDEGYGMMMAAYGGGNPSNLIKAFITPFTDVFDTAVASAKMTAKDAITLLPVTFGAALSTIIPGIGVRFDKIFAERDKKIEDIKREYKDVFDRTSDAFKGDAKLLAFMAAPSVFLASSAALKVPSATKKVLSVATGGITDKAFEKAKSSWDSVQKRSLSGEKSKNLVAEKNRIYDELISSLGGSASPSNESFSLNQQIIVEDEDKKELDSFDDFLKDMLSNKKVVAALSSLVKKNPTMQSLYSKMSKVEDETLKSTYNFASKIENDPEVKKGMSKAIAEIEKKGLKPEDKKKAIDLLTKNIKDASKQALLATLKARQSIFPEGSAENKKYQAAFKKLTSP